MAEELISLGCDSDEEIAFDEEILQYLREKWQLTPVTCDNAFDEEIEAILNADNDALCDPNLFSVCEEESVDIDELMDSEDDEWLLAGAKRSDQQGANPLFSVLRQRLGATRQWQNGTVIQDRVRLQLQQNRVPQDDLLGEAVAEAFYQNVRHYVQQEGLQPQRYCLQMKIHHNGGGRNAWTSSPLLPLDDWINNRERTRQWIQQLANELNSMQTLDVSKEDFFAEFTLVKTPSVGGRFKKYTIKSLSYEDMLKKKKCIITIRNKDDLCCARAIVTLKARINQDAQYRNLRDGYPIQERLARALHRDAQVPEQACGPLELNAFQAVLGPDYQLMVVEGMKGQIIYKNQAYDSAEHAIALLKIKSHYHAITSLPAFLNRSYFCRHCERAYYHETAEQHNCKGQNCLACRRGKKQCKNFATWVKPTHYCNECNRSFYGPDCFDAHKKGSKQTKSVCKWWKKCLDCCKVFKRHLEHQCYTAKCGNCGQTKAVNHQCFIQPYKAKKDVAEEEDEAVLPENQKPEPLIIAFDIECEAKAIEGSYDKVFEPVLIGWSTLREVDDYKEVTSIQAFLKAMKAKTVFEGDEREVFCFAHNLRAFDGLFIQERTISSGLHHP